MQTSHAVIGQVTQAFLAHNSQFHQDYQLHHQALAILMKAFKDDSQKDQVFLVAGSEDLRALLSRLKLDDVGDEAFILVRPYIHTMLLYIRRESTGLCSFLFDSQNWGLRYYPTRLIVEALLQHFANGIHILLSGTEVQAQSEQRGCSEYSLQCLAYLHVYGNSFFKAISTAEMEPMLHPKRGTPYYQHTFQYALPPSLLKCLQQPSPFFQQLDALITENYQLEQGLVDHNKIDELVKEMQGCFLTPAIDLIERPLYDTHIDLHNHMLTIQFPNKNYLYSNFLIHSQAIYPSNVSLKNSSFLLDQDLAITYDEEHHRLIYQAQDRYQLQQALENVSQTSHELFHKHMRQQLALQVWTQQVQEKLADEIELNAICNDKVGGLDHRQVQLALAHVLGKEVHVPNFKEFLGEEARLDLDVLKKNNKNIIAFSLPILEHHIGVLITLSDTRHDVLILDPKQSFSNVEKAKEKLAEFLCTATPYTFQVTTTPFQPQKVPWSCGAHVMFLLQWACSSFEALSQQAYQTSVLDVYALVRYYYGAYKTQQKIELAAEIAAATNDAAKRNLLACIQQQIFRADANPKQTIRLKELASYLLCVLNENKSLQQTWREYKKNHKQDETGQCILQIASLYGNQHAELEKIMEIVLPTFLCELDQNQLYQMNLLVGTQLDLILSHQAITTQRKLIKALFDEMLNAKSNNTEDHLLAILFASKLYDEKNIISCKNSLLNITENSFMQFALLIKIIAAQLNTLSKSLASQEERLLKKQYAAERKAVQAELENKTKEVKKILETAGVIAIDEMLYRKLADNMFAYFFLNKYVPRYNFLQDCEPEKSIDYVKELIAMNSFPDIFNAIRIFPGHDFVAYLLFLKPFIDEEKQFLNLFKHLNYEQRYEFIKIFIEKITSIDILKNIIEQLLKEHRLEIILKTKNLIRKCLDLVRFIPLIPPSHGLKLAIACSGCLPGTHWSASSGIFHRSDSCDLPIVLKTLPEQDRLPFAKHCKNKMSPASKDLYDVLKTLLEGDRFELAYECQEKITTYLELANIISLLPQSPSRFDFAVNNFNRILPTLSAEICNNDMDHLLQELADLKFKFIEEIEIKNIDALLIVLGMTKEPALCYAICNAHKNIIQSKADTDRINDVLSKQKHSALGARKND